MAAKHKRERSRPSHGAHRHPERHREAPGPVDTPEWPAGLNDPDETVWLQDSQLALSLPMERLMGVVGAAVDTGEVQRPEDIEKFLAAFSEERYNRTLATLRASSPRQAAQQLAYDALLDADSDEEALELARRALELDPHCVDARMVIAECTPAEHMDAFIEEVRQIVADGERDLGAAFFQEHEGEIWEPLQARPYLRARYRLADACRLNGRLDEAVRHLEALLKLNRLDHQRAREPLLACYLTAGRLDDARRLLLQFPLESSAVFHWSRALERFLSEDAAGAYRALQKALEQNPFAESYLSFEKKPPAELPETYMPGDEDEAAHCLYMLGTALAAHPGFLLWLRQMRKQGWK